MAIQFNWGFVNKVTNINIGQNLEYKAIGCEHLTKCHCHGYGIMGIGQFGVWAM